jgi:hypothetical protein
MPPVPTTTDHLLANIKTPTAQQIPGLLWAAGTITEILVQPKEMFYVVVVRDTNNKTTILQFGDPYTGTYYTVSGCDANFQLVQQAFFTKTPVQIAYRDWGYNAQAGTEKFIIDRVIVNH